MAKKRWFRWIRFLVLIYAFAGIGIFYLQNYIILHPKPLAADYNFGFKENFREVTIPYNSESRINIIQFKTTDTTPRGVVLYFHGNRDNINRYAPMAPSVTRHGYEIWMIDYPGFGKSTGKFREEDLYEWALTFYKLARARFTPDSIILYGRSLGSGIAAQLASIRDCKFLLLETPYYSMPSLFSSYAPIYPFERLIHYKFPTGEYLKKVDAPVIIFHGDDDGVIPLGNAKKLIPSLKKNDRFITIADGSHNNLAAFKTYQNALDSILMAR